VQEYTILQSLQHDRIVQVYDLFEAPTQNKVYVVMEFCQGGELFERIVAKTTYNEKEARDVIRTLLTALAFCHEDAGVVHRDLKVRKDTYGRHWAAGARGRGGRTGAVCFPRACSCRCLSAVHPLSISPS
jgi:serine/threonine protein kinase